MKFKVNTTAGNDIPTAALPDIIFMLLFFFMVTTVLRETEILVEQDVPRAEQLVKLERKDLVGHLYLGKPKSEIYGTESLIQASDAFVSLETIGQWVNATRDELSESLRDQFTVALKTDKGVKMGLVTDLQSELREVNARKLLYQTPPK